MPVPPAIRAVVAICAVALAGCSSTEPVSYQSLASARQLTPRTDASADHIAFTYSEPDVDWRQYQSVLVDPVAIYGGSDQQFDDMSREDKVELAHYMHEQLIESLKTRFTIVTVPSDGVIRVRVTLTGAETSTPVLSTLSKIVPVGLVVNTVQTAADAQGPFTGSVSYAVELYDGPSDRLLRAYVAKQYPWAVDVTASFGRLDASKSGIRSAAAALLVEVE